MSVWSLSDVFRQKDKNASYINEPENEFREGVLLLKSEGIYVQRYFTIYDGKIVYAYRGKERKHEFSPITKVEESKEDSKPGQFVFKIITDGQRNFELATTNIEDLGDWIKATKDEVCKIICSILDDLEKKDQPNPHSEGSQIEEGVYSSYLLRKQGNKVMPLYMTLMDGKLSIKRRSGDSTVLGSWKVHNKTVVEVLDSFAGPSFSIDQEILFVNNNSVRSNWIVALRSSMSKYFKSQGNLKLPEIDFGCTQQAEEIKTTESESTSEKQANDSNSKLDQIVNSNVNNDGPVDNQIKQLTNGHLKQDSTESTEVYDGTMLVRDGTMFVREESEDLGNNFYKTFAGSVRITGKILVEEFSTFRPNDAIEDDQEKFANMQLEFEEIQDVENDPEGIENEEINELVSVGSEEKTGDEIVVPVSRNITRARSQSNAKHPHFMRIRVKTKSPEGPIKIYRGCIQKGEPFKSLIVTSDMKTAEVLKIVLQKYEIDSLKNLDGTYVLIEEEGGVIEEGKERYRRILDASESPFIAKLNWDHRNLQFAIAKKEEFTNQLVEGVKFKVKTLDGSSTMLKFSSKLSALRICEMLAEKFNLQKVSFSLFSLWMTSERLELQLEPFQQIDVMNEDWKSLERRFSEGESPEGAGRQLIYRRWAFLSKATERRCKDPAAIHLLYDQASKYIMEELYPFPNNDLEDMFLLASLKCQLMFGDYNPDVHVPGWICKNTEDFKLIFPPSFFSNSMKKDEREKRLIPHYKKHAGHTKMIIEMLYLQYIRQWPYYGSTFFPGILMTTVKGSKKGGLSFEEHKSKGLNVRVGVNVEGIHIFDSQKNVLLLTEDLVNITICTDLRYPNSFIFECQKSIIKEKTTTLERRKDKNSTTLFCIFSPQAQLIQTFVTSALHQQAEDARALRIMRNLQRKRSASDVQNFHRENLMKFNTQKHVAIQEDEA